MTDLVIEARGLRGLGKTVLLTTHYMEEAERLADRLAIIAAGRIVAEGTVESLRRQHAGTMISFRTPGVEMPAFLREGGQLADGRVTFETDEPTRLLHQMTHWASEAGLELEELRVVPTSLEEIYLGLVGSGEAGS